ncbi:MAG: preprotein translocase subunit SecG [Clostridia bacterium]|nr:preprotein translocase subunit SecG [Clostridia bacterium]
MIAEYILLGILLVAAVFIVVAVTMQRSEKDGLSGTIVGGTETYYGKEKSVKKDKVLYKWTLIVSIIFAVAVLVVYIIQPDFHSTSYGLDQWQKLSDYSGIFS